MLALQTYKEQLERFLVSVVDYHASAREIAERTWSNDLLLQACRQRLSLAQELARGNVIEIDQISQIMQELEQDKPNVSVASALLADLWTQLIAPSQFAPMQSFSAKQSLTDEELLLSLMSEEELTSIRAYLSRPTFDRLKWNKGDYLAISACILLGIALDVLNVAWKADSPIDPEGHIRKWFDEKLHVHPVNNPIDYQGPGFSGGFHRARSRGHDLARFLEAVRQTHDGEFRGERWFEGHPIEVISRLNQYGAEYPTMDWFSAFINVATHLFADFFSTHSLPLPLSSVIYDHCDRELRKFVVNLYEEEFHLRHVTLGALEVLTSFIAIDIWLWLQNGTEQRKSQPVLLKRAEMRASTMAILSGANLTGCAILQNPFNLNVPVLIAAVDSSLSLLRLNSERHHWTSKAGRNIEELAATWAEVESTVTGVIPAL